MRADHDFYLGRLYPMQDRVLARLASIQTGFYLTGGTAASPRDFADIWGFCCRLGLSCEAALEGAQSKAAGLFPADVARTLLSITEDDWQLVRWHDAPESHRFIGDLKALGERLLLLR